MSSPAYSNRRPEAAIPEALTDLALDLRWSFNHSADQLWERLDPELWELTHNPWVVLQTVSRERLQSVTADASFQKLLANLQEQKRIADAYIQQLDQAKVYRRKIVTQVVALQAFYPAEGYHQNYAAMHPDNPYIVYNDAPKVANLRKEFPEMYTGK